jgi:hypothetical protein
MNEVTLGDKIYISSKRAAEITGYAKDYVGQLCREGHVDAKMIGRSWYVYEPSIKAHRFGPESIVEAAPVPVEDTDSNEVDAAVTEPVVPTTGSQSWEKPLYTAESPQELPEIPVRAYEEVLPPAEETLTDMQTAWKEWFDRKQEILETPEIESPEVMDARADEYEEANDEVEIPLHRIDEEEDEEEVAEPIRIRPIAPPVASYTPTYASMYANDPDQVYVAPRREEAQIISERVITKREAPRAAKKRAKKYAQKGGSNAPMIALLLGISIVTIAITVIGSGIADQYVQTFSSHNAVIDFLTGTREVNRQ